MMLVVVFLLKRLAGIVVLMLVVSFLVFGLMALSPGSIVATLLGTHEASPAAIAAIKAQYHLDDPFLVRYGHWLGGVLHGNFGRSVHSGSTVTSLIASHLPVTLELALYAAVLVVLVGISAGFVAGIRRGGVFDRAASSFTVVGMSAPGFAVGIVLIYLFGVKLSLFPVFGAGTGGLISRVEHLTLPAIALAFLLTALVMRQARATAWDVMNQNYITFARARGLSRPRILAGYALRNTALPVVTAVGLLLIVAIPGAVLVETVFALPGAGALLVQSVLTKDIPVVQGIAFFIALLVMVINLLVDVAALVIDPRTRTASAGKE